MVSWKFKSWRPDGKSKTVVTEWYKAQNVYVRETFKARLRYLRGQPIANWTRPYVAPLRGGKKGDSKSCNGLWEIRFEVHNVQYRPIGHISGDGEFTIVAFAKEIGGNLDPPSVCAIAKNRIADIKNKPDNVTEWRFERESQSRQGNTRR